MSYEAKTKNLNLPQWVSGDKPEMLDFNKAFQAIDTGVGAKQNKIAASGILKGNGAGGVSAAVAGTDYATSDMAIQTLTGTIDFNTVTDTGLYRIKGATSFVNGPPVSSFPFDGVSYVDTLLQVDNFRSSVIMQTIRYGTTCMSRSTQMYGDGKTWGAWTASAWTDKLDKSGGTVSGNLVPNVGGQRDLGSETKRWNAIHAYTGHFNADILMGSANTPVASSGSNSNGNWVKFYDGTMICWMTKDFGLDDVVNPWGVLYDGKEQRFPDFPVPFASKPTIMLCPEIQPAKASFMVEGPKGVTATNPGIFWASRPSAAEGQNVAASYIAIGRWK